MPVFPIIIEQEYNSDNSTFSFHKMGDKRIFSYNQGNSSIVVTKSDELHLTVKETITIVEQLREWLFKIKELYQIPLGQDENYSVQYLVNEDCTLSFNELISFLYNKNNHEIILITFDVPINISLVTLLRRTQEILDWISRDFNIWVKEIQSK